MNVLYNMVTLNLKERLHNARKLDVQIVVFQLKNHLHVQQLHKQHISLMEQLIRMQGKSVDNKIVEESNYIQKKNVDLKLENGQKSFFNNSGKKSNQSQKQMLQRQSQRNEEQAKNLKKQRQINQEQRKSLERQRQKNNEQMESVERQRERNSEQRKSIEIIYQKIAYQRKVIYDLRDYICTYLKSQQDQIKVILQGHEKRSKQILLNIIVKKLRQEKTIIQKQKRELTFIKYSSNHLNTQNTENTENGQNIWEVNEIQKEVLELLSKQDQKVAKDIQKLYSNLKKFFSTIAYGTKQMLKQERDLKNKINFANSRSINKNHQCYRQQIEEIQSMIDQVNRP